MTFGPPLGDTIALIDTQQGAGLRLAGTSRVRVDRRGYAIAPYLTPYRLNDIEVDPVNAPRGVRVGTSSRVVVPVAGAIVRVAIEAKRVDGRRFRVSTTDGRPPPFGAAVRASNGDRVGSMGQGGRLALAENIHGALQVDLAASHSTCRIELDDTSDPLMAASTTSAASAVDDAPTHLRCR
jgi:outer membrane usher protein